MENLTLKQQVAFYIQWCKDNNLRPQDFANLIAYFNEIKVLTKGGAF